jgi:hypothetical protein
VEVKCAFTASPAGPNSLFFKFPLGVCIPSGSASCVASRVVGPFHFSVRSRDPLAISVMTAKVPGRYDASEGQFVVDPKPSEATIIVTSALRVGLASCCVTSGKFLAVTKYFAGPIDAEKNSPARRFRRLVPQRQSLASNDSAE